MTATLPSAPGKHREVPSAFTLAEMLVVMAVIAILLMLVVPAFSGLSNGSSRRGAVGNLLAALDRARMMALSDGLSTYVVFAVPVSTDGKQFRQELWGRAYAIYEDHDNINFSPEQKTAWMQLPLGMAFKTDQSNVGGVPTTTVTNRPLSTTDPAFPVAAGALISSPAKTALQLPYWKFDATGSVDEQTPYLRLLLFPGYFDPYGNESATKNTSAGAGNRNSVLLEEIDINSATGRAKYISNPFSNLATPTPSPST